MTTNSQLSTTEPETKTKKELSKQLEQEQIHRNRDHIEGYQWGGGVGRIGEKVQGIRSINREGEVQNRQWKGKYSMGYGKAKELICMTHGHELRWGNDSRRTGTG